MNSLKPEKRPRGRPATGSAMSDAERARRYRAAQKARKSAELAAATAGAGSPETAAEIAHLQSELSVSRQQKADLASALEFFLDAKINKKKIAADIVARTSIFLTQIEKDLKS